MSDAVKKKMWCHAGKPLAGDLQSAANVLFRRMPSFLRASLDAAVQDCDGDVEGLWFAKVTITVEPASAIPAKVQCECGGEIEPIMFGCRCLKCGSRNPRKRIVEAIGKERRT